MDRERIDLMLNALKTLNYEAYLATKFMFLTATRVTATLKALIINISEFEKYADITIYDKGIREKYPEGHEWHKYVKCSYYYDELKPFTELRTGTIFKISKDKLTKLNKDIITSFCPELIEKYGKLNWNHFWRHMFAQHMLRKTGWNYAVVAFLGGWTVQALQESYGKPTEGLASCSLRGFSPLE